MAGPTRSRHPTEPRDAAERIPVRRGVKALLTASGSVLLVEERHADGSTFWTLPGGGLAPDETATEGLRRELTEELNCRPVIDGEVDGFWYVHASDDHTITRYRVFAGRPVGDVTPAPREGILDADWFPPSDCPTTTLPQVQFVIEEVLGGRRTPGVGTDRAEPAPVGHGSPRRTSR